MWVVSLNEGRIEKKEFHQAERAITGRYIAVSASLQSARGGDSSVVRAPDS